MISADDFMNNLLDSPEAQEAYVERAPEFQLQAEMLRARQRARMTQKQVAEAMGTTDTAISRLEAVKAGKLPSLRSLQNYAKATKHRMVISFEPIEETPAAERVH